MEMPELSKRLHPNSGSVFRDVNSMYNTQMLLFQPENGKNLYSTNLNVVSKTVDDLVEYLRSAENSNESNYMTNQWLVPNNEMKNARQGRIPCLAF